MPENQDINLNIASQVEATPESTQGATGVPYPAPPAKPGADYWDEWPADAVDIEAMRRADANYSRTGILTSAPDRPEIKNVYGGSITPPWATEAQPSYPEPPSANLQVEAAADYGPRSTAWGKVLPAVNAQVEDWSQSWQGGPAVASAAAPPPAASPRFDTYKDYQAAKADYRTDLENVYTQQGRAADVGGRQFDADLENNLVSAGLTAAPRRPSVAENLRESMTGYGAINYGYVAMQAGQGAASYYEQTQSGQYVTPEQRDADAARDFAPAAGAALGTVIGGMLGGGMGAWAGGMVGGGIGSAIGGVTATNLGVQDTIERASDSLSVGRGGAAAVQEFVDAIRNAGVPAVKELADVMQSLGHMGPVAASGAAGLAPAANYFGPAFQETVLGAARFAAATPGLMGLDARIGTDESSISSNDLFGAAGIAAFKGDYDATMKLSGLGQEAVTRQAQTPNYNAKSGFVQRMDNRNVFQRAWDQTFHPSREAAYDEDMEDLSTDTQSGKPWTSQFRAGQENAAADAAKRAAAIQDDLIFHRDTTTPLVDLATANIGLETTSLQSALLRGGGAASITAALPGLTTDAQTGQNALTADIGRIRALEATASPDQKRLYDAMMAQEAEQSGRMGLVVAGAEKEKFTTDIGENTSAFDLSRTSALYGGASAASLSGDVAGEATRLRGFASNPLASPEERDKLNLQAVSLEYQQHQDVYRQEEEGLGVRGAQRQQNLAYAQDYGTPDQVFSARHGTAQQDLDSARQLNSEIERGNLTYDQRLDKQRQIVELNTQAMQIEAQARQERASANYDIAETGAATSHVGMDRALGIGGTAGVNWQSVEGADQGVLAAARGKLAAAQTPQQVQAAQLAIAQAQLGLAQDVTGSQTFRLTSQERIQAGDAESAFHRSMIAPWMDGSPDSNPLTAGQNELSVLQRQLSEAQRQQAKTTDPLAREANENTINSDKNQIADIEHERMTGWLNILPEMVAGSPGEGVSSAVIPFAALAAAGRPSTVSGGFGATPTSLLPTSSGGVADGGAAGGFSQTSGIENLLASILRTLQQGGRGGVNTPTSAPIANGGAINQVLDNSYDPFRRRP